MIPLLDYQRHWRDRQSEFPTTIPRVLNSGQLILGAEGSAFESSMADLMGMEHGAGGDFPVVEKAAQELLSLPLFPELAWDEQDQLIDAPHGASPR